MAGSQGEVTIGKEIEEETTTTTMTTTQGLVSGAAVPSPPVSLTLWLAETIGLQTGPVPVFSSHSQPESGLEEELLLLPVGDDACSPTFRHRDGRKRKEFSTGGLEEDSGAFDHKRHRQVHLQSSASSSYGSVAMSGTDVLSGNAIAERPGGCLLSVPLKQPVFAEQVKAARVLAEVDTSSWNTDGGHVEISGGNTSAFASSEEGDSQRHQSLGRFVNVDQKEAASVDQNERATMHMWSDSGGLLSLQLDTFIAKEKEKLESSDTAGSGAQSFSEIEHSLSGSLHGVESLDAHGRPFEDRLTGTGGDIGSCSMEDGSSFLAGSSTQASQERSRLEILELDPVNSMLLSHISKHQCSTLEFCCTEESVMSGIEDPGEEERKRKLAVCKLGSETIGLQGHIYDLQGVPLSRAENMRMQDEDGMTMPDPQTFILSSGRPSSTEDLQLVQQMSTIDCDFDAYFSKLML
ncbi:unnamed protein product [Sphagnum balticum]